MTAAQRIRLGVVEWFKPRRVALSIWCLTTAFLFSATSAALHTAPGKLFEVWWFGALQQFLSPFDANLPVVVVDVDRFKPPASGIFVTPRPALERLLGSVASAHPRAIAVDIDFGMIDGDWPGKAQDPPFFDRLLALQEKLNVPIFLAVERTIDGTSGGPLGLTRWDGMAVATQGEDSGPEGHTLAAPFWYVPHDYPKPLPNLSVAVAQAYLGKGHVKQPPFFLRPFVEAIDISRPTDVATLQKGSWYGRAFLNYSKLRQLARECLRVDAEHVFVPNESVQDKMVIVGFANRKHTTDTFHAPWSPDEAGVMFHAVAAYTLAVEPVYELRPNVRVALDIVFSFAAFLALTWTLRSKSDAPDDAPVQRDQRIVLIAVVAVLLFGLSLTKWASILWLDFFVVALSLVVHPFIAGIAERWHARRSHPSVPRKDPS